MFHNISLSIDNPDPILVELHKIFIFYQSHHINFLQIDLIKINCAGKSVTFFCYNTFSPKHYLLPTNPQDNKSYLGPFTLIKSKHLPTRFSASKREMHKKRIFYTLPSIILSSQLALVAHALYDIFIFL